MLKKWTAIWEGFLLAELRVKSTRKLNWKISYQELSGKDVFEVMEAGRAKLADVPAGGGAPVAAGGSAGAPAAGGAAEEKPKEKTPESESDTDSDESEING